MTNALSTSIRAWMTSDVVTIGEDENLLVAIRRMHENSLRRLPVLDSEGNLVGILTETDIRGLTPFSGRDRPLADIQAILEGFVVHEQMSKNPVTISPDKDLADVIRYFLKGKFGGLPVLDGGELAGIITETDVLRAFLQQLEPGAEVPEDS